MAFFEDAEIDLGAGKPKKIYRGAYNYVQNNQVYSEEAFEVYRNRKEMVYNYISEIHSRVSTGELLKIFVNYQVNKDFIPTKVTVKKDLGKEQAEETYRFDSKKNLLSYTFKNKDGREKMEMNTAPRFHITTPAACTSMLFILSKKLDTTGKNIYNVVSSLNKWQYEHELVSQNFALERISLTSENIMIDGQELQGIQYKLFEDVKDLDPKKVVKPPTISVWLSRHLAIPYSLTGDDGTKVVIKYLNNLDGED